MFFYVSHIRQLIQSQWNSIKLFIVYKFRFMTCVFVCDSLRIVFAICRHSLLRYSQTDTHAHGSINCHMYHTAYMYLREDHILCEQVCCTGNERFRFIGLYPAFFLPLRCLPSSPLPPPHHPCVCVCVCQEILCMCNMVHVFLLPTILNWHIKLLKHLTY